MPSPTPGAPQRQKTTLLLDQELYQQAGCVASLIGEKKWQFIEGAIRERMTKLVDKGVISEIPRVSKPLP